MALTDFLFEGYDVPKALIAQHTSQRFDRFVTDVFVYAGRDGIAIEGLSPSEHAAARDLVRRNLHLRYSHLLSAVALLRDLEAVPQLEALLAKETKPSWRAEIARCLLQLTKDSQYIKPSQEFDELSPDEQRAHIENSPTFQAALLSMQRFDANFQRERAEQQVTQRREARHTRNVALLVAVTFVLVAAGSWMLLAR